MVTLGERKDNRISKYFSLISHSTQLVLKRQLFTKSPRKHGALQKHAGNLWKEPQI